ncbi:MAG: STAS domain-containing protein [Anaerolineales bacterium]|nr:STAS domain-containing protein [Anaerolineales bacterium]
MMLEVIELENGIKQIMLNGRLDIPGTNEIENSFTAQTASKKQVVLVDMAGVEFITSYGMRILVSNAKSLARRGGKMVLYKPLPSVKDVLVMAGIGEIIPIYDDFDAACADLKAADIE